MLKMYKGSRIPPTADSHSSFHSAHTALLFSKEADLICHYFIILLLHAIS